jgi:hypothetical protein
MPAPTPAQVREQIADVCRKVRDARVIAIRAHEWSGRRNAFASRICRGVWPSGSNSRGLATRNTARLARDVPTFSRFRL